MTRQKKKWSLASLAGLVASSVACGAQSPPVETDACNRIHAPAQIQVLMTLDQAQLTLQSDNEENGDTVQVWCAITLNSPLGQVGTGELRVYHYPSRAEGLAYLRDKHTNTSSLVPIRTTSDEDVVQPLRAGEHSGDVIALHGDTVIELTLTGVEDGARAHPTWGYRMEREALQAAGATVLPEAGMTADPVPPVRAEASAELKQRLSGKSLADRLSFWWPFLIGPGAVLAFLLLSLARRRRMP